jgi:hypothetical protein
MPLNFNNILNVFKDLISDKYETNEKLTEPNLKELNIAVKLFAYFQTLIPFEEQSDDENEFLYCDINDSDYKDSDIEDPHNSQVSDQKVSFEYMQKVVKFAESRKLATVKRRYKLCKTAKQLEI